MEGWQVLVIFIFHFKGENYCDRDNTYPIYLYRTNYPVEKKLRTQVWGNYNNFHITSGPPNFFLEFQQSRSFFLKEKMVNHHCYIKFIFELPFFYSTRLNTIQQSSVQIDLVLFFPHEFF